MKLTLEILQIKKFIVQMLKLVVLYTLPTSEWVVVTQDGEHCLVWLSNQTELLNPK